MNDYQKAVRADPKFRAMMQDLAKSNRPIVPKYSVCSNVEERETLIETIKIKTGEQKGFDLLAQLLTGETPT